MLSREQQHLRRTSSLAETIAAELNSYSRDKLDEHLEKFHFPNTSTFIDRGYTYKRTCDLLAYYLIRFSQGVINHGGWNEVMDEYLKKSMSGALISPELYWKHLVDIIEVKDIILGKAVDDQEVPTLMHSCLKNNFINVLVQFLVIGYYQFVHDALKWFEINGSDIFSTRHTFTKIGKQILDKKDKWFDSNGEFDITKVNVFSNDLKFGSGYSQVQNLDLLKMKKKNMEIEKSISQDCEDIDGNLLLEEEFVL